MEQLSIAVLAALFVLVAFAYFVGAMMGFGTSILLLTFASQFIELKVLLPIAISLNIGLQSYLSIRHRRFTQWRELIVGVLPYVAIGMPIGIMLFSLRDSKFLLLGFGLFVVILALLQMRATAVAKAAAAVTANAAAPAVAGATAAAMATAGAAAMATATAGSTGEGLAAEQPAGAAGGQAPMGKVGGGAMLILGGLIQGLYASAGPIIVYVLARRVIDKNAFRSTVATLFLLFAIVLEADYALTGLLTVEVWQLVAMSIPAMIMGIWAGERAFERVDTERFRSWLWLLLLAGGSLLTVRTIVEIVTK